MSTPFERANVTISTDVELTVEQKKLFAYFGENARIKPPLRIANPHRIRVGDRTVIQEHSSINAFENLTHLRTYIDPKHRESFADSDYLYESHIDIGTECQIGRFFFLTCASQITFENNVLLSERIFVGDNNHTFKHPDIPIMQQPNQPGEPILIQAGSWIGIGAVILKGTRIGKHCVVAANSVCKGVYPSYSVIGTEPAKVLFQMQQNEP